MYDPGTGFLLFLLVGGIALKTLGGLLGKYDKEGAIADTAKGGLVRMIGRWMK